MEELRAYMVENKLASGAYMVENKLASEYLSVGNLEKLRRQINRHKAYKAKLNQETLLVMSQPIHSVHDQGKQEIDYMIIALLRIRFKREIIDKCSMETLRRMVAKMKKHREQKQKAQ
ncbi:hypothetical protein L1987_20275 [Smallanthus sonchifolius]|uniref:Uncharacterized protein n=1 Tax=Smallanthus sonchifolius TaxID=185202 RepID=A0ACB9IQZ9_9ASTR|nr:hypothetical protein L1987_20275 [Smallanthus sonchifolius]